MVSKAKLQDLDFKTIEEYFDYIIRLKNENEDVTAQGLYDKLNKGEKADFKDYIDKYMDNQDANDLINFLEEQV
jgi:hypothetical protein